MRLALIGDIHCFRRLVPPWRLLGKRLLGQANLLLHRQWRFHPALLPDLVQVIQGIDPEMLLCTGDLTTTALPAEFADAAAALRPLLDRTPAVILPGNHDRYTFSATSRHLMEQYLPQVPAHFPFLRPLTDAWRLLALDSAVPRALTSRGRIGPEQLASAGAMLAALPPHAGLVVLCHYPIAAPPGIHEGWDHRLADAPAVRELLTAFAGPVVYLHGHIHSPWAWVPDDPALRHVLMINAGSPCRVNSRFPQGQGFWEIELENETASRISVRHHCRAGGAEEFAEGREMRIGADGAWVGPEFRL